MKRLHVHLNVSDLDKSIVFYNRLFNATPSVSKTDYAKWELDNPAVNFAISTQGEPGLQHLGIQAFDAAELAELYQRTDALNAPTRDEGETTCCYARSEKMWVMDPQDVAWELFQTHGKAEQFHSSAASQRNSSCCEPGCCQA
jgi:lactoylglutathione lyase